VAKKLGQDYRLWIESATPGTYNIIKGQTTLSYTLSGQTVDTSSKDDFPYKTSAAGMKDFSIQFEIIPDLPDANGYTRFETVANASSPTAANFQIRKNGAAGVSPGDVVIAGSFFITGGPSASMNANEPVKATGTLEAAAAPTTFALA
jgi:predicted secreted protein